MTSFKVTLSGRGSPIFLKPYRSHICFRYSPVLSAGDGAAGIATAFMMEAFFLYIEILCCLNPLLKEQFSFTLHIPEQN